MSELAAEEGVDPVEPQVEEPAVEEAEAPEAAAEPSAPAVELPFDPDELQAELEYTRSQNEQLYAMLQQFASGQQAETQPQSGFDVSQLTDEYGNLSPQGFMAALQANNQQLLGTINEQLQAIQAPIAQQQEAQAVAEGNQRLQDIMADDIARNGEFASDPDADAEARKLAMTLASTSIFPDLAQRHGATPRVAEMALTRASEQVRGLLRQAGVAAVTQTQNQLANLANAHGEPGVGGPGTEVPVVKVGGPSLAERYAGTFGGA